MYDKVGLYNHNVISYEKVKNSFLSSDVVGIVHATGTGKSYNALQLAYDNKDKKIIYVVPSNAIIEHLEQIIKNNPNLDRDVDFSNLEFRTYSSFVNMSLEEIEALDVDILILDEFHHIGAPIWGSRINSIIETHPNIKIFGMTAYTVRDRGTSYERDMADSDGGELFSNKIVSRYDLCDAMIDGVLPKPIYKTAYTNLIGVEQELEKRVDKLNHDSKDYQDYMKILNSIKKRIHEAPSIKDIVKRNIKPCGKYIYFCPPAGTEGVNDIETIKSEAMSWFKEITNEEDIIFYTSTSDMPDSGRKNRNDFYNDVDEFGNSVDGKIRVMFAINQYNEGVHAPNIDGVFLGRGTQSDIVFFEQIGRALSVRGNTKEKFDELNKYSLNELIEMCKKRDISITNYDKNEIIEKLLPPTIIDLTNNFGFIKELENNLKDRIKEIQNSGLGNSRQMCISDASFDIEILNVDLYEMLRYVSERLTMTWDDYYELAKNYYEVHGNLEVPCRFKTNDGYTYDENGIVNLGTWIVTQRQNYGKNVERDRLLIEIGMRFENKNLSWEEMYEYAKIYCEKHGNLEVPGKFKTNDGYTYDENGEINLGQWIPFQRRNYGKNSEHDRLLLKIGMRFENIRNRLTWEEMYEYAKKYYEKHGNLEVPQRFKTNDGYTEEENGKINLGNWISKQRQNYGKNPEYDMKLTSIGMIWNIRKNQSDIEELCLTYGIDYEVNKSVLSHLSITEFKCKILYLNDNGLSITTSDLKLHEIFSMSSMNMKLSYGVSLEDLVNMYEKEKKY